MDIVFHLVLPFLLLLLFGIKLNKMQAIVLAFFSILPDFDRLILKSRQGFHSVFFVAIVLLLLFLLLRKKKDGNFPAGLAALGIFSHLLFDLGGPVSFLYPFDTTFYTVQAKLIIEHFIPKLLFSVSTALPIAQGAGEAISESGFAILLIALALFLVQRARKKDIHFLQ